MAERMIRCGSVASVWLIACNIGMIFSNLEGFGEAMIFAVVTVMYFAGYFCQALVSKIERFKRVEDEGGYESDKKFFKPIAAIPSFVVAVVLFFVSISAVNKYMIDYASRTKGYYYDSDGSVIPFFIATLVTVVFVVGIVIWFIPSGRLMSTGGAIVGAGVMLASSIFSAFAPMTCVYLVCYVTVALLTVNQNVISKKYRGTVVTFVTSKTRGLNASIVGALLGIAAVLTLLCAAVLAALIMGILFPVLAVLFSSTGASEDEYIYDENTDVGGKVGEYLAEKTHAGSGTILGILALAAVALLIVCLIFFIFRKKSEVAALISRIKEFIESLFGFWFGLFSGKFEKVKDDGDVNYKDEERKVDKPVINPYIKAGRRVATYKDFAAKLKTFQTSHERLMFAYVTMVGVLKRDRTYINDSDTPREICEKLKANTSYSEIENMTDAFETVAYSVGGVDNDSNNEQAIKVICIILQANMV